MARAARAVAAALLAAAGLVAYGAADVADVLPGPLTDEPRAAGPTLPPAAGARVVPGPAPAVLAPATAAALEPRALAGVLDPLVAVPALGERVGVRVVDGLTGDVVYRHAAPAPQEPASTAKLLTAAAALSVLGPGGRLPTRVVRGDRGEVVLVAGGDVLLTGGAATTATDPGGERAGLRELAAATARALADPGDAAAAVPAAPVRVRLDDGLFAREGLAPGVTPGEVAAGFTAPLAPLAVDAGRTGTGRFAARSGDPALAAATRFAALLAEQGVAVDGGVTRSGTPPGAPVLAEVRSAPVAAVVAYMLRTSDNLVADALAHVVARRTGEAVTFAGSGRAVLASVETLGADTADAVLADGSGLGDGSAVRTSTLTDVLVLAGTRPDLAPLLTGLPVGGLSGTLADRFAGPAAGGAGLVRAKTGTLTGTTGLAGTVVTADGGYLAFAVLADAVPSTVAARQASDEIAAALAGCGCR